MAPLCLPTAFTSSFSSQQCLTTFAYEEPIPFGTPFKSQLLAV